MLLLLGFFVGAEVLESPAANYPSSVGVFGSSLLGGGLSYQRWSGPWGFSVTAGGNAQPATYYNSTASAQVPTGYYNWSYNLELQGTYKLYSSDFWNWLSGDLFAYAMLGHKGAQSAVMTYNSTTNPTTGATTSQLSSVSAGDFIPYFDAGAGIGYELTLFQHFSIPLEFGYTVEWPLRFEFTAAGGLRYRY
jgi:hypothetical protein